ncbi:MAG TPA: DUF2125 domain-containing protein, partial [Pseudolabrys sp.]|nr:DUF2125 domain-containing protein [Pseudolabrys sp.]
MVTSDNVRRRKRRYIILVTLVVLVCGGWSAFWFYAAHQAQQAIAGWKAREAAAGRDYTCGHQGLRGFPFRIEVDCSPAAAAFESGGTRLEVATRKALVVGQVYGHDLLIAELTGPLTVGEPGKPAQMVVNWQSAVSSIGGNPIAPSRMAVAFDDPTIDRIEDGQKQPLLKADHVEFHGRLVGGTVFDRPEIELAL